MGKARFIFPNTLGQRIREASDGVLTLLNYLGTNFSRLQFGGTTSSFPSLKRNGTELQARLADDSNYTNFAVGRIFAYSEAITNGSGTGISVAATASVPRTKYIVTIAKEAFTAAATTEDVTIATLPAKTLLRGIYADLTAVFALGASQLSIVIGRGSGGSEFLASFDADAAAAVFGDADGELGTEMTRAAAIQGGALGSWTTTTPVVLRLTSGTDNLGDGDVTALTAGSVTVYLITERL